MLNIKQCNEVFKRFMGNSSFPHKRERRSAGGGYLTDLDFHVLARLTVFIPQPSLGA